MWLSGSYVLCWFVVYRAGVHVSVRHHNVHSPGFKTRQCSCMYAFSLLLTAQAPNKYLTVLCSEQSVCGLLQLLVLQVDMHVRPALLAPVWLSYCQAARLRSNLHLDSVVQLLLYMLRSTSRGVLSTDADTTLCKDLFTLARWQVASLQPCALVSHFSRHAQACLMCRPHLKMI